MLADGFFSLMKPASYYELKSKKDNGIESPNQLNYGRSDW